MINLSKATGFRDESVSNDGLWPRVKVRGKATPWAAVWLWLSVFCGWAMPDGVDFLRSFLHASILDKSRTKSTVFRDESASNDGLWPRVKVRRKSVSLGRCVTVAVCVLCLRRCPMGVIS